MKALQFSSPFYENRAFDKDQQEDWKPALWLLPGELAHQQQQLAINTICYSPVAGAT
jgi:hypothetical protein